MPETLNRETIVRSIAEALEPLDYVYAMWEGGAVAFGRVDEWSDIDICIDADDERVKEVFPVLEHALESLAPIELKYDVVGPLLGEYVQAFYRLEGTSKFLLIDFAVFKHSAKDKLLEPELHGSSKFHFNKGNAVEIPHLDREKFVEGMRAKLDAALKRFETFSFFIEKEINRGNWIEALGIYHRLILHPLVMVLRMVHKPVRYDFTTRYINYDLPPDVVGRLTDLYFVKDAKDLSGKYSQAETWFRKAAASVDFDEVKRRLSKPS